MGDGPQRSSTWVKTNVIKEDHHGRPIWCVAFNTEQKQNADLFATVGGNTVRTMHVEVHLTQCDNPGNRVPSIRGRGHHPAANLHR